MSAVELSEREFADFQTMLFNIAGIHLSPAKRVLVSSRLQRRLGHYQLNTYKDYYQLITRDEHRNELQTAIDLLTTNETHFFREPKHFDFLQKTILPNHSGNGLRIWSAASSSGEEAYSIAMLLAEKYADKNWQVLGTDISTRILDKARAAKYPLESHAEIPENLLKRYCLKGSGPEAGNFVIRRELANRVKFTQLNLNNSFPAMEPFDVIFLRNVMIYFTADTKRAVLQRILQQLKPGGYLFIGHSESLQGLDQNVTYIAPSIFRKP